MTVAVPPTAKATDLTDLDAVEAEEAAAVAVWCSIETAAWEAIEEEMKRRATVEEVLATMGERIMDEIILFVLVVRVEGGRGEERVALKYKN